MEYIHVEKELSALKEERCWNAFRKTSCVSSSVLTVLIQEVFVQSSFSFQYSSDNMCFVILHFAL